MLKVLIAEDNIEISDMMRNYLLNANYTVYQAFDGAEAVNLANSLKPDILLLDIMMPVLDGFKVCEMIRKSLNIPIIVISAISGENDKINMLQLGADDYITKPFSYKEMVSRVNAQLRRFYDFNNSNKQNLRIHGSLSIDSEHMIAYSNGNELRLTAKEFKILDLLTLNKNITFTKQQIIDSVWGLDAYIDDNTLTVTIARLRDKLTKANVNNIVNIWGIGYKWKE